MLENKNIIFVIYVETYPLEKITTEQMVVPDVKKLKTIKKMRRFLKRQLRKNLVN